MKLHFYYLIVVLFTFHFSNAQNLNIESIKTASMEYKGTLTAFQFEVFKNFIVATNKLEINNENSYIINYNQNKNDCFHDKIENESAVKNWIKSYVYKNIKLNENTLNLFYQREKAYENSHRDIKYDLEGFINDNFINGLLCFSLVIINSKGEYRMHIEPGHSNNQIKIVNRFLEELKINN
jgi:hypothetical protein